MKKTVYFNYTACVAREVKYTSEGELETKIEETRAGITDEEILDSTQENSVDY